MQFLWIFTARITNFVKKVSIPAFTTGLLIGIYPAHSNFIDYIDTAQKIILVSVAVFTAIWTHKRFSYSYLKSEAEDLLTLIQRLDDALRDYEMDIFLLCRFIPEHKDISDRLQKKTRLLHDLIGEVSDFYLYKSFTSVVDREIFGNILHINFSLILIDFYKAQNRESIISLVKECSKNVNLLRLQIKKSVSDLN